MKCYAKDYCKGWKTEKCNELCNLYVKLNAIYAQSNIPQRYRFNIPLRPQTHDKANFLQLKEFQDNIIDHVENGDNLFIFSPTTGNGKTAWSTKIANQYIRKTVAKSRLDNDVMYMNVSEFLSDVRDQFTNHTTEFLAYKDNLAKCKLLIMDDIGAEKPSDWVRETLYNIINNRYMDMKSTIFTSNCTPEQLESQLGNRIKSRVCSSQIVELKGFDRRDSNE